MAVSATISDLHAVSQSLNGPLNAGQIASANSKLQSVIKNMLVTEFAKAAPNVSSSVIADLLSKLDMATITEVLDLVSNFTVAKLIKVLADLASKVITPTPTPTINPTATAPVTSPVAAAAPAATAQAASRQTHHLDQQHELGAFVNTQQHNRMVDNTPATRR